MTHPDLVEKAREVLVANGFEPDPPSIGGAPQADAPSAAAKDLRSLLWSSIDDEHSKDLDQIEYAERRPDGSIRVLVGIADVDGLVPRDSAPDRHAAANATSVYTGIAVFPMLARELSEGASSLLAGGERQAVVIEMVVAQDGGVSGTDVYLARVKNAAKLAYDEVGAWLEGGEMPAAIRSVAGLDAQLAIQQEAAQRLRGQRERAGALELDTIEARPVAKDGHVVDLAVTRKSKARDLIEDFMIAANVAIAIFLEKHGSSGIRRVVREPERWDRLVKLASQYGESLPAEPDSLALSQFLSKRRAADPERFVDLSLTVVKLLGPGEYALDRPGKDPGGHFGLAAHDYSHATAPNRRFADLVTQRLVKAVLSGAKQPYDDDTLAQIAAHCTEREDAARKVERTMRKIAAADLLSSRIGESFDAIVTGVSKSGTFVRLLHPAAEGRVMQGEAGMDVGDRVRVRLVHVDPDRGFIDFARA